MSDGFHEEESLGKVYDRRLAGRLFGYLRPYRTVVSFSVALLLLISGLNAAGPIIVLFAIDHHISSGKLDGLDVLVLLYAIILLVRFGLSFLQTYLMIWIGQHIMFDLRRQIFRHVQTQDLAYFDRHPVGRLITRITTDVDVLNELFTSGVVSIFGDLFLLTGIVTAMLWINWKLALVSFLVIPLLMTATMIFKLKVRKSFRTIRTCVAKINSFLQENITGMSVVQLFRQEQRQAEEFRKRNREHLDAFLESIFYYAVFYPVVNLLGAVSVALILWYGGLQVLAGTLTLGSVVAFIQYSERFFRPISDLSEKFNILQSAMASAERIFSLLDSRPSILQPNRPFGKRVRGAIEFEDVDFSYASEAAVLKDVTFRVEPGEKVAIVGATGAGKSTIIGLLARFYDVQSGAIRVDGQDVRQWDLRQLRDGMAIVLQDPFLFRGSMEENIGLWETSFDTSRIRAAARRVRAEEFVLATPDGYSTPVSERGTSLSVGQRQLLAFARALVRNPAILILDEATSSVDTETEIRIQEALAELMQNRTALIVAHRLSTIQSCDRIVVLHKGEIQEQGNHRELLERRGLYHRLFELQYKDQLPVQPGLASSLDEVRGSRTFSR